MQVQRAIARLQPSGSGMYLVGAGGRSRLEWQDIAGAFAGGGALGWHLVRAKYAHDKGSAIAARQLLVVQVLRVSVERVTEKTAQAVCESAVCEYIASPACDVCSGSGLPVAGEGVQVGERMVCESCNGTGKGEWRTAQRARAAGMDADNYRRRHSALHKQVLEMCGDGEMDIVTHLEKRLH